MGGTGGIVGGRLQFRLVTGLAVLVVLGSLAPATPAVGEEPSVDACPVGVPDAGFQDVATSSPHAKAIDCAAWWGITNGVRANRFAPSRAVPRDQLAAFVARLLRTPGGQLTASPGDRFNDDRNSRHHFSINRLATVRIVRGRTTRTFEPERTATRGQVATVLASAYAHRTGRDLPAGEVAFVDVADSVHRDGIARLAGAGIAHGTGGDRYEPDAPVTRAPGASLAGRLLELLADEGELEDTPATLRAASDLRDFESCEDLLATLKERALERGGSADLDQGVVLPQPVADDGSDSSDAPEAPSEGGDEAPGDDDYQSGTNVQEQGVDEPDIVKTDGRRLFVTTDGVLRALDLDGEPRLADEVPLAGDGGHELFLHGDRLLTMGARWSGDRGPAATLEILDASDVDAVAPERLYEIDGRLVSARLVDGVARVVVRTDPPLLQRPVEGNPETPMEAETLRRLMIETSTLADWLPHIRGNGVDEPLLDCSTLSHPPEFSGLGTLSVVTVDLRSGEIVHDASTGVLAGGDVVYASRTGLYVATTRWQMRAAAADALVADHTTEVHAFGTGSSTETTYEGSGKVPGWLINQFALSEHDGHLRVATTVDPWAAEVEESESLVTVLEDQGDELVAVGELRGLGPGERIYAVRFLGDVGYVVTFRQVDPLYVLDLSDPRAPALRGELKIAGYSAYLHPLGDGRLLGVGQDATDEGRTTGTQLSLFDVSDPDNPQRLHKTALADTNSEVEWDHRAFLWWGPEDLIVLPIQRWTDDSSFLGAVGWTLDVAEGFTERGRVSHPAEESGPDDERYTGGAPIRRSLVVGDRLYTLSHAGLLASDLTTLEKRVWVPFD